MLRGRGTRKGLSMMRGTRLTLEVISPNRLWGRSHAAGHARPPTAPTTCGLRPRVYSPRRWAQHQLPLANAIMLCKP
jgi:hypothetical protein